MKKTFAVLLLFLFTLAGARAENAPPATTPITQVTLGHSVVALTGPWKFHIGDDPRWADPGLDDSSWENVDLAGKKESIDPMMGTEGFSPGWTAKGHPGYSGYAWYRIRIRVTGATGSLALLAPTDVDDSYQLFTNGILIGSLGSFARRIPTIYYSRPLMFELPAAAVSHSPDGTMVLAFRFYMAPRTLLQPQPGGMHGAPVIGLAGAITAAYHVAWEGLYRSYCYALIGAILFLVFALLILMLYVFDRTEKILLWPLAACVFSMLFYLLLFTATITQWMTVLEQAVLTSTVLPFCDGLWLITWWVYFGLQEKKWIRNAIGVLVLWNIAARLLFQNLLLGGTASHGVFAAQTANTFASSTASILLLILIAYFGIRREQRIDWLLCLSIFFYAIPDFDPVFHHVLHIRTIWFPLGVLITLQDLTVSAVLVCFSTVLLRRFRNSQRRQQALEQEVKQAQEVQHLLIPEELPRIPGLTIESEYRPAREVGGDFFQTIPHTTDGSVLLVAGDVTGKGLQAGMLVALIVGAIHTAVEASFDPLDVLQALNRRLCGREQANATCLAMRIASDGAVTMANAGHLPPYINGKELPMEGALPLGIAANAKFSLTRFQLAPGDRLMLMSDGVVEAQDEHGHLFGFDRVNAMLQKPVSAAEVANAAQSFGQEDDISVLSVTRSAALQPALA